MDSTQLSQGYGSQGPERPSRHRMLLKHERDFALGMDVVGNRVQRGWVLSWLWHGCSAKNAMRGGRSDFEASEDPKVLLGLRRPVPADSGRNAFVAR